MSITEERSQKHYWTLGLGSCVNPLNNATVLSVLGVFLLFNSCAERPRRTEDPQSSVVKLREQLTAFAKGELNQIRGSTGPDEAYILMYGYQGPLNSLPISEILQRRLEAILPRPTEMYVLAHTYGDDIEEYTEWDLGHDDNYHPLLWPMPSMIRGDSFKITATKRERYSVDIKIEPQ